MSWKQGQVEDIGGLSQDEQRAHMDRHREFVRRGKEVLDNWESDTEKAVAEANAPFQRKPGPHPSGITPTEFKVLLLTDTVEERTAGGIIKPVERVERDQYAAMEGVIIAASPLAFTYENWPEGARKPQVGDRVIFAKYAGATVEGRDGVKYRLVADKDIGAVLE